MLHHNRTPANPGRSETDLVSELPTGGRTASPNMKATSIVTTYSKFNSSDGTLRRITGCGRKPSESYEAPIDPVLSAGNGVADADVMTLLRMRWADRPAGLLSTFGVWRG